MTNLESIITSNLPPSESLKMIQSHLKQTYEDIYSLDDDDPSLNQFAGLYLRLQIHIMLAKRLLVLLDDLFPNKLAACQNRKHFRA